MNRWVHAFRPTSLWIAFTICIAAVVLLLGSPLLAQAAGAGCRTDPIVVLQDGRTLRITVNIETSVNKVNSIYYTLHVPPATRVKQIVFTGGKFRNKEVLQIVRDAAPRTFAVDTLVNTTTSAHVTSTTTLRSLKVSADGQNGELLSVLLWQ